MKKLFVFLLLTLFMLGVGLAKLKVAFVYVGPVGDHGWTYAHDLGRRYIEKIFDGDITTTYIENVPDGMEAKPVIESLAKRGFDIIFTTSFGFMDATLEVAKAYPKTFFFHCSGYKTYKNMTAYFGRMYEPSFLAGIVAGMMTKSNIIGYVAPIPIPEVVRITNAFALGVKLVNPKVKVHVVWTHSWYDPATESEAARSLIDLGADVIAQQTDSAAPVQVAEEKGVYSIGYNSDMKKFGPKMYLTAPIWNWGVYYERVVREVMNGTYKSENYWGGMADGIVKLAPLSSAVPYNVRKMVRVFEEAIKRGEFHPFLGPVYDQEGKLRIKDGEIPSDSELLSMMWFVDNIVGTIPKGGGE
ncbi:MAG: BMP family ABC transporter substrate-binding protein [Thermotogae bacterium]|nr:BMP family ABC transporter substrate-binding protein [Thermotogota bacterium]